MRGHHIHIHLHDAFEEGQHPRGEGGKFTVSTEKVPHPSERHRISTKVGPKETPAEKHNVSINGEHIGHVHTHVEHKLHKAVGKMRPTGVTQVRWAYQPRSGEGGRFGIGSKREAIKYLVASKIGYPEANKIL